MLGLDGDEFLDILAERVRSRYDFEGQVIGENVTVRELVEAATAEAPEAAKSVGMMDKARKVGRRFGK